MKIVNCPSVQHFKYVYFKKLKHVDNLKEIFRLVANNIEIIRLYQTDAAMNMAINVDFSKLKMILTDAVSKSNAQKIANSKYPIVDYRDTFKCSDTQDFEEIPSSVTRVVCRKIVVHQELFPNFLVTEHLTKLVVHAGFNTPKNLIFDLNMLRTTSLLNLRVLSLSCILADSNSKAKQLVHLPKLKSLTIYKCHIAESIPFFPLEKIPHLGALRVIWTVLSKDSMLHLLSRCDPKIVDMHFDFAAMVPIGHYPAKLNSKLIRGPMDSVHPAYSFSDLVALNLSGCMVSKLPLKLLQIPTLKELFLSSNSISELPALPKNAITSQTLEVLKLDRNQIKTLPSKTYFEAFPSLKLLDLRANPLVLVFRKLKTTDSVAENVTKAALLSYIRAALGSFWASNPNNNYKTLDLDYYQRMNDNFSSVGCYMDGAFSAVLTVHNSLDIKKHKAVHYEVTSLENATVMTKHRCASFMVEPPNDTTTRRGIAHASRANVSSVGYLCSSEQFEIVN